MPSIRELIGSVDPLSDEAAVAVLHAREESELIDFKLAFDEPDREWLELTKDVMAFANSDGGYLVFGVKDGTFEYVGLGEASIRVLRDPNNWLQKLNRFVEPSFTRLRCKEIEVAGKKFVVVFIPPSRGLTHIVTKEGAYKQPSGQSKTVLRRGTLYVRRSGTNNLADARDLDAIFIRRLDHFRSSLLDKIARVVDAPAETEVLVVRQEGSVEGAKKFVIENAPDAIAVKGMSFSVAPETSEQEIAAWIAMTTANSNALPPVDAVWKWYRVRREIEITKETSVRVAMYSILRGAPAFYWLRDAPADAIKPMLSEVLDRRPTADLVANALAVSAFLGTRFHKSQVSRLGAYAKRLHKRDLEIAPDGPRWYFESALAIKRSKPLPILRRELEAELDSIAQSAAQSPSGEPDLAYRYQAQRLDCFLYAQDDEYKNK